jgi:glycerol uptake facilitator-like aquaporin
VTIARSLSDTFAGIRPADVPLFIVPQIAGALCATVLFRWLAPDRSVVADHVVMPYPASHERRGSS